MGPMLAILLRMHFHVVDRSRLINISYSFARLNDADRCEMMRLLALIPCISQHSAKYSTERDGIVYDLKCDFCDISALVGSIDKIVFMPLREVKTILLSLLGLPEFEQSRKPRILAMLALRNLAMHHQEPDLIDLEESPLGQWCLGSLRSSVRELRVAAGYVNKTKS
jgi:serine/threonine-protein kinase ATR